MINSEQVIVDVIGAVPLLRGESDVTAAIWRWRILCGYDPAELGASSQSGRTQYAGNVAADGPERFEQRVAGPAGHQPGRRVGIPQQRRPSGRKRRFRKQEGSAVQAQVSLLRQSLQQRLGPADPHPLAYGWTTFQVQHLRKPIHHQRKSQGTNIRTFNTRKYSFKYEIDLEFDLENDLKWKLKNGMKSS